MCSAVYTAAAKSEDADWVLPERAIDRTLADLNGRLALSELGSELTSAKRGRCT
jgi:hypothetical protein